MARYRGECVVFPDNHGVPEKQIGSFIVEILYDAGNATMDDYNPLPTILGNGFMEREFHLVLVDDGIRLDKCRVVGGGLGGTRLDYFGTHPWP